MTTSAAYVQLPCGWLFRDSAGNWQYMAVDGMVYPLRYAIIDNPSEAVIKAYDSLKVKEETK